MVYTVATAKNPLVSLKPLPEKAATPLIADAYFITCLCSMTAPPGIKKKFFP